MPANRLRRIHPSEKIPPKSVPTLRRIARGNRVLSAPSAGQPEHAVHRSATPASALATSTASALATSTASALAPTTAAVGRPPPAACGTLPHDFRARANHSARPPAPSRGGGGGRGGGEPAQELDPHQQRE